MQDGQKDLCLSDEIKTAYTLVMCGFGELQELQRGDNFYYLPQQLLASGLERLLKCYICLVKHARDGEYPDQRFLKEIGHDLKKLRDVFVSKYSNTCNIPLIKTDLEFVETNSTLDNILFILSEFGKKARYYNLDIVAGSQKPPINPYDKWKELERDMEDLPSSDSPNSFEDLYWDYYPRVNSKIIARLERFMRAIVMQTTLGNHGGKLKQMFVCVDGFVSLKDNEFGTIEYRRSVQILSKGKHKLARSKSSLFHWRNWPSVVISKQDFDGDWPFRSDQVTVECRRKLCCIVVIEEYEFALNGAAKAQYNLPTPHEAGIAILGKSIGPFIDKAFSLVK